MREKNCVNCGAPIDPELIKCPYCGTCHLDFSAIDLAENTPIYITYRIPRGNKSVLMTQLAVPMFGEITYENNFQDIADSTGTCIRRLVSTPAVSTNLTFRGIPMSNGIMYKVQYED